MDVEEINEIKEEIAKKEAEIDDVESDLAGLEEELDDLREKYDKAVSDLLDEIEE